MWTQFLIQFWILLVIALGAAVLLGRYIGTYFAPVGDRKIRLDSAKWNDDFYLFSVSMNENKTSRGSGIRKVCCSSTCYFLSEDTCYCVSKEACP